MDWELKERTRWRDVVPDVKTVSKSGQKRSRSKSRAKPGKRKRIKKRARLAKVNARLGEGSVPPSGSALTQPGSGLPETRNGIIDKDVGREDVVILDGIDLSEESEMEVAADPGMVSFPENPGKRTCAAARRFRRDARPLTYNEIIEGGRKPEVMFPDDLEFQFEVPPEVEDVEIW